MATTSLESKLARSTRRLLLIVISVSFLAMVASAVWAGARERRQTEEQLREAILDKGVLLSRTYATSLRPLVSDNAFTEVEKLLNNAVRADRDLLYAAFVRSNGRVWALARRDDTPEAVAREADLRAEFSIRDRRVGDIFIIDRKEAVEFDGEELGSVVLGISTVRVERAVTESREAQRYQFLISAFALLLVMVVVSFIAVALTRRQAVSLTMPIVELAGAVNRLAQGDGSARVEVKGDDEVAELGHSFNQMTQDLALSRSRLESTNSELAKALSEAREVTRLKSEFLASMSHELRTPLNSIINIPEGLLEDIVEAEGGWRYTGDAGTTRQYLQSLHSSGTVLLGIVNQVLDFSKLEAGKMQLVVGPVSPIETVQGVIRTLEGLASKRGITLAARGTADTLMVDQVKFSQILLNLGSNAIKFSHDGGLVVFELEDSPDAMAVHVRDDGIGIAPGDQAYIFESFRQVEGGATRRFGGTGLGLSISKQLAELHGGTVSVHSVVGQGSTFTVQFPRRAPTQRRQRERPCLVMVDDEPIAHETMKLTLRSLDIEFISVTDSRAAMDAVLKHQPDLVVLDIMMPKLSGLTLLQSMRSTDWGRRLPILVMSAYPTNKDLVEAFHAIWMSKPYDAATTLATVRRLLGLRVSADA